MRRKLKLNTAKRRRALRARKRIPRDAHRLSVWRTEKHMYAQIIDNATGNVISAASTVEPDIKGQLSGEAKSYNVAGSKLVGEAVAKRAKDKGVTKIAFDRGPFRYHGRVKALADAAREAGLEF